MPSHARKTPAPVTGADRTNLAAIIARVQARIANEAAAQDLDGRRAA